MLFNNYLKLHGIKHSSKEYRHLCKDDDEDKSERIECDINTMRIHVVKEEA